MFDAMFNGLAAWFGLPAVLGTIFFVVRLTLLLVGGDGGDAGGDVHVDVDAPDADVHGDPGDAMKILSIQSVFTFMMGFGWGGLAALHAFNLEWPVALLCGTGVGVVMVWVLGLGLKAIHDLQSDGNVSIGEAVGAEGSVYVRIPPAGKGRGQVRLVIGERQRIYDAVTDADELPRSTRVRVTRVNEDNTITVTSL